MTDYQGKGWYLRKVGTNRRFGFMLHFIQNNLEFASLIRSLPKGQRVSAMTWHGLVELTGCVYPATCEPESIANMGMTFRHNDRVVSVMVTAGCVS